MVAYGLLRQYYGHQCSQHDVFCSLSTAARVYPTSIVLATCMSVPTQLTMHACKANRKEVHHNTAFPRGINDILPQLRCQDQHLRCWREYGCLVWLYLAQSWRGLDFVLNLSHVAHACSMHAHGRTIAGVTVFGLVYGCQAAALHVVCIGAAPPPSPWPIDS